ncbi:peptidylprolyl isomerase [Silvimonas soli]|uniref:peptidylprolyl isomerase n=1 Tax=Silvimonas soli TaxID=2980100 RepID=UPI0024B36184|nr:peptidyl-prolyl cis-trans isomerase [Silvimonas soli]
MKKSTWVVSAVAMILAVSSAFAADKALPAGAFAVVNGVALPQSALDQLMHGAGMADTATTRLVAKNQLVARELFRQQAVKAGLPQRADVQAAIKEATDNVLTQTWLRENIKPVPVTDADVQAEYNKIAGALGDKEYKLSMIQVADDATARTVLAELKKGAAFEPLARKYSQAPSRANGGQLDWVSFKTPVVEGQTQGLPLALAQAAVHLTAGGITTEPVAVGNSRVLLRLDQVRATQVPKFDDVKPTIRARLQQQALQKATVDLVVSLLKAAQIQQ